jgi:hypothetical protein
MPRVSNRSIFGRNAVPYPVQAVAIWRLGRMSGPLKQGARMSTTAVRLFRGVRKDEFPDGVVVDDKPAAGILYPSFEPRSFEKAGKGGGVERRVRPADSTPFTVDGVMMVEAFKGTSLFDRARAFGSAHWRYFTIPAGTEVPGSILVRHTGRFEAYAADHYQIEPAMGRMRLDAYKGALDNLARSAVVRFIAESGGAT